MLNSKNRGYGQCIRSPCPPGEVPMSISCEQIPPWKLQSQNVLTYKCYEMHSQGPCEDDAYLGIDLVTTRVICTTTDVYGVFPIVTARPCSAGSERDSKGRCRVKVRRMSTRIQPVRRPPPPGSTAPTVAPTVLPNGNVCPPGHYFYSDTCISISIQE